jgi:hypothetical protein
MTVLQTLGVNAWGSTYRVEMTRRTPLRYFKTSPASCQSNLVFYTCAGSLTDLSLRSARLFYLQIQLLRSIPVSGPKGRVEQIPLKVKAWVLACPCQASFVR